MTKDTDSNLIFPAGEKVSNEELRLDVLISKATGSSRSWSKEQIKGGKVTVNGNKVLKPSSKVNVGDVFSWPELNSGPQEREIGHVDFEVVYEDDFLAVIEKPWGVVCHSGAGTRGLTLAEGLKHRFGELPGEKDREGLVHRLDRGTHGLMVVSKREKTHYDLQEMIRNRKVKRTYFAIVAGESVNLPKTISTKIARHPKNRKKFTTRVEEGRDAVTHISSTSEGNGFSLVELNLETGRTHQIRVHLSESGFPIVNDDLYSGRKAKRESAGIDWDGFALVAKRLQFVHPETGKDCIFEASIPKQLSAFAEKVGLPL